MKLLRYGDKGSSVDILQLALLRAGYDPGSLDGIFGARTQNALISFQRASSLTADGIAGDYTNRLLRRYITGYIPHRVEYGDTYFKLSRRFNTSVAAIAIANPSQNFASLIPGSLLIIPLSFDVVPENIRYSSELSSLCIEGITMRYPFVSSGSIGRSLQQKRIYDMRIGTGGTSVMYSGGIHANEWITVPLLLKYTEQFAKAYSFKGEYRDLYDSVTIHIVPLINPDGLDIVTDYVQNQQTRSLAENYPNIPYPSGWKANISGVDLNVNFPAMWERARDIKFAEGYTLPGPRDYPGDLALSEPESRAMTSYTMANDFKLILAYHTQGEVIYWKYDDMEPVGSRSIGEKLSQVSGYVLSLTPPYSAYAGYKDWFIQEYNRPGYTVEVGKGINPLPISQLTDIYEKNKPLMDTAAIEASTLLQ